ncbi:YidC/Oxa1 family membrane protein insertase [Chitinophaga sp. W2I13]|uniref:membrane protein insertase YidC n=1 Tax=Chitinophaga sp. W2I13 TaxID=3373923 RepID=UPI003D1C64B4
MDRNSVIGFLLLGVLLVGYIFFNQKQQAGAAREKARQDSIAELNKPKTPLADTVSLAAAAAGGQLDSAHQALLNGEFGVFAAAATGNMQNTVLENDVVKITFSNKGGQPASVQLKKYKTYDGGPLMLVEGSFNRLSVEVPASLTKMLNSADLFFTAGQPQEGAGGVKTIAYRLNTNNPASYLEFIYSLKPGSYVVDYTIHAVGMQGLLPGNQNYLSLQWNSQEDKQEHDLENERLNNQVHYMLENDKHDYFTLSRTSHEKLENKLKWVSVKQQFFNTTLIAKKELFTNVDVNTKVPVSPNIVGQTFSTIQIPYSRTNDFSFPVEIYYGPNHYKTLKSFDIGLQKIIPLGTGIFAFVKYVNIFIIIPVFNFLSGFISNYGIIIILLTLFIRLLIAPFTYQSYVSPG